MRRSTIIILVVSLAMAAGAALLAVGSLGLVSLLLTRTGIEPTPTLIGAIGTGIIVAVTWGIIFFARKSGHRSWWVNTSRYPAVRSAIEKYKESDETVRRVLPAFLVDGGRYFLVRYLRKGQELAPYPPGGKWGLEALVETGIVVLDDKGIAHSDEDLFRTLAGYTWHIEDSFGGLRLREDVMGAAVRMQNESVNAKSFFARHVIPTAGPKGRAVLEPLDALLVALGRQMQQAAELVESEHRWCETHHRQVEFTSEEMAALRKARAKASAWLAENARTIAEAWGRIEAQRANLENLPELGEGARASLRTLLDGLGAAAKSASDPDNFKMLVSSKRVEAYRARTAKALRLEGQAQQSANAP